MRDLVTRFCGEGRLEAIVLRPARRTRALRVDSARVVPGYGLVGDRRAERLRQGDAARRRELTLLQHEHLAVLGAWCGIAELDAVHLRRNLVVSGVNLLAMRSPFAGQRLVWRIGREARIEVTGACDPCSRIEEALGMGGYNAMRGHGGVTARIVGEGALAVGDRVVLDAIG